MNSLQQRKRYFLPPKIHHLTPGVGANWQRPDCQTRSCLVQGVFLLKCGHPPRRCCGTPKIPFWGNLQCPDGDRALGLMDSCQASLGVMQGPRGFWEPRRGPQLYLGVGAVGGLGPGEQPGPGGAPGGEAVGEGIPDPAGRQVVSSHPQNVASQKAVTKLLETPQNAAPETP